MQASLRARGQNRCKYSTEKRESKNRSRITNEPDEDREDDGTREARRTTKTKNASKSSNCPPEAMKSRNEEKEICFAQKGVPLVVETRQ